MWHFNKKNDEPGQNRESVWTENKEKYNNLVDFLTRQYSMVCAKNDRVFRYRCSPITAEDYVREVCGEISRFSDLYRYVADHHSQLKSEAANWKKLAAENKSRADQNQAKIDELTNYIVEMQDKYATVDKLMENK